jgi:Cytidylate kinase-like family
VSREEALRILKSDDEERRKWSLNLYGIDTTDPSLYDLVIHIKEITVDDAAGMICQAVELDRFRTTAESQKAIDDLALGAEVRAALFNIKPDVDVQADDGFVYVETRTPLEEQEDLVEEMKKVVKSIPGVRKVEIKMLSRVKWSDGRLFP